MTICFVILILFSFFIHTHIHSVCFLYIRQVTLIMMPLKLSEKSWDLTVICSIMWYLQSFGIHLTSYILVALTLNQYIIVTISENNCSKQKIIKIGVIIPIVAYLIALILSLPELIIYHYDSYDKVCLYNFTFNSQLVDVFIFITLTTIFIIPMIFFLIFTFIPRMRCCNKFNNYLATFIRKKCFKLIDHDDDDDETAVISTTMEDGDNDDASNYYRRENQLNERIIIALTNIYIVCWTPCYLVYSVSHLWKQNGMITLHEGFTVLQCFKYCLDPIVYLIIVRLNEKRINNPTSDVLNEV